LKEKNSFTLMEKVSGYYFATRDTFYLQRYS